MTQAWLKMSEQTRVWFLEWDARAYPALIHFCVELARRQGAGLDAEDLTQGLLLDLLQSRDRGTLELPSASAFERYVSLSLRRRRLNLRQRYDRRRAEAEVEDVAISHDAPDAALRSSEHLAFCQQLILHALHLEGVAAATCAVVSRIFERYVGELDIEDVLVQGGLLDAAASAEERRQARENENRRQSRARAVMFAALDRLAALTAAHDASCSFSEGSRRVSFDSNDVREARSFAEGLGRCERPRGQLGKGK